MGWVFPTLVLMMAADFLSGLSVGKANEGLSSAKVSKGFVKKMHILIIISAVVSKIAKKYNVTIDQIKKRNKLDDNYTFKIKQKLRVK